MSNGTTDLRQKIGGAGELQGVVRAMKALAASSIGQYEKSTAALDDYSRALDLSLGACLREAGLVPEAVRPERQQGKEEACAVVFGSDQGLVGQFNGLVADFAVKALATHKGKIKVWAVGERVDAQLADAGLPSAQVFPVPSSVKGIVPLVGQILIASRVSQGGAEAAELLLFYNRPISGAAFEPVTQRLLPLDEAWVRKMAAMPWPAHCLPQVLGSGPAVLRALINGYLFVSLFRACAESLASENASRLAAMQRADKNIDERLEELQSGFHRLRQSSIDEELFDVISGFDALSMRVASSPGEDPVASDAHWEAAAGL